MARHLGALLDLEARTVRGRRGELYQLDRVELVPGGLAASRHMLGHARFDYLESWLLAEEGWSASRFTDSRGIAETMWYVETEVIEVDGSVWTVQDGFIDFYVFEG